MNTRLALATLLASVPLLSVSVAEWTPHSQSSTEVRINDGVIQGSIDGSVRQFRKIPYASPPLGSLRWAPPEPPVKWGDDVLVTDEDPPGCIQTCNLPPHGCPPVRSENCLYLNVFTPVPVTGNESWPVMLWIHGGNFFQGYGGGPLYNGTYDSGHEEVVIVAINYRLGALGFLWSAVGPSGNYGMMDQKMAIQWTVDNIAFLNGDPSRITLFGQSAGAMSVGLHMVENYGNAHPPFAAAIMESNPYGIPLRDTGTWGILPHDFYEGISCAQDRFAHDNSGFWECIRAVPVDTIRQVQWTLMNQVADEFDHFWDIFMPWTPTMGTDMYPSQMFWQFQKGHVVDVPFVLGMVRDEALLFIYEALVVPVGKAEMDVLMDLLVGVDTAALIKTQYPYPSNSTDMRPWASQVVTDGGFRCPSHNASAEHALLFAKDAMQWPSFFYHFNRISSFNVPFWGTNSSECWGAVCHAAELPYVFHPNPSVDNTSYAQSEYYLMDHIQSYWTTFAKQYAPGKGYGGAPPNCSGVEWTMFDGGQENTILLDVGQLEMSAMHDKPFCDFWDAIGYSWMK